MKGEYVGGCTEYDIQLIGLKAQAEFDPANADAYRDQAMAIIEAHKDEIDEYWTWENYGWTNTDYDFWLVYDRTEAFDDLVEKNGAIAEGVLRESLTSGGRIRMAAWWAAMVRPGGPWDIKAKGQWRHRHSYVGGNLYSNQDLGNLHYGYVGRKAGFTSLELKLGGSAAQLMNTKWSWWSSWFHDPRDAAMIQEGFRYTIQR